MSNKRRPLNSIAVQGYIIPPGGSVLLRPCANEKAITGGFLRAHNVSKVNQTLTPSTQAQQQWEGFQPEIKGDDVQAAFPMAWSNADIRFEIICLPDNINGSKSGRVMKSREKYTKQGSKWTMQELMSAIEGKTIGSTAALSRAYMGYDRVKWQVFRQEVQEGKISGVTHLIVGGRLVETYTTKTDEMAYVFNTLGCKIGFVVSSEYAAFYEPPDDTLRHFLDSIGTSGCISLLQKAIRRRPRLMSHPDTRETFDTREIVRRLTERHCRGYQPGVFLPRLGMFISGLQHFLKRLFIIAAEDSVYSTDHIFDVSVNALLASLQPLWRPSESDVKRFVQVTLDLLEAPVTSHYDTSDNWPLGAVQNDFQTIAPCLIQAELGGMQGDQRMLRYLATHVNDRNTVKQSDIMDGLDDRIDSMDIYCDQHQDGRLVCLLEQTTDYPTLLDSAFRAVSGFNTRRGTLVNTREVRMVHDALHASSRILRQRQDLVWKGTATGAEFAYTLAEGSIAGMVGDIYVRYANSKYIVTVCPRDIQTFRVIPAPAKRPSKSSASREPPPITSSMKVNIINTAKKILTKGRPVRSPVEQAFEGKIIHYNETKKTFLIAGQPWESQRHRTYQLTIDPDWSKLTERTSKNVSWSNTFGSGHFYSEGCRQFVLGRMAGYSPLITIPKINRVGKGTDASLLGVEGEAYQYLMYLSEYFPDAIWPTNKKPFAFETKSIAFRQQVCQQLRTTVDNKSSRPHLNSDLVLRSDQSQAIQDMIKAHDMGLAIFLWMLVGQGKTLTVLRFLDLKKPSKYIVWVLPKSAVSSVASQIGQAGWSPIQLYPSRSALKNHSTPELECTGDTTLQEKYIYLIEHDHLRKLADRLASQMTKATFIFDEVHKVMQGGTQRTMHALRLGRIASQLIALTGTPIVDNSASGLTDWLRLCVPFPVNHHNFYAATNSMVSYLNVGQVLTENIIIHCKESNEEKAYFKQYFPARQPWYGDNEQTTPKQWKAMRALTESIVTKTIIQKAVELISPTRDTNLQTIHAEHETAIMNEMDVDVDDFTQNSQRPFIVAANKKHSVQIIQGLLEAGIQERHILSVGGKKPHGCQVQHLEHVDLTEQAVLAGNQYPYQVVVVPIQYNAGYSATWMTCMITGCYPSNQAARTQIRGRINRAGAQRLKKRYLTVLAGITTLTYAHQDAAKMIEDALSHNRKRKHSQVR